MQFDPTDEQRAIQDTFHRFAATEVRPRARELDEGRAFPRELFRKAGELGLFAMRYPEPEGRGADVVSYVLALEELAWGSLSLAAACTMQSLMGTWFLHRFAAPAERERLLLPALRGDKVGAICMTEPDAGSDLGAIATRAVDKGGRWLLTGAKTWVTSAPVADFFTVFARSGEERKLTIFLVERSFAGLTIGRPIEKMGMWALPTSELSFNDCFVPDSHRLSKVEGDGESHLRKTLAEIRIITGAMALGVSRADTCQHSTPSRTVCSRPVTCTLGAVYLILLYWTVPVCQLAATSAASASRAGRS